MFQKIKLTLKLSIAFEIVVSIKKKNLKKKVTNGRK